MVEILTPDKQTVCCRCPSELLDWNKEKTEKVCPHCGCRHGIRDNGVEFIEWLVDPDKWMNDKPVGEWYKDELKIEEI